MFQINIPYLIEFKKIGDLIKFNKIFNLKMCNFNTMYIE